MGVGWEGGLSWLHDSQDMETTWMSIHLSMDIQVVSISWLSCCNEHRGACVFKFHWSIVDLQCCDHVCCMTRWFSYCMYLFELQFCPDICPGVGLLDHMVVPYLVFWGTSIRSGNTFFFCLLSFLGLHLWFASSWFLVGFVSTEPRWELPAILFKHGFWNSWCSRNESE